MGSHGADDEVVAVHLDALELGDARQVHEIGRRRQALFHGRQQGLSAGHEFDVRAVGERERALIVEVLLCVVPPYSPAALTLLIACHTRWGEAGMVMSVTPSGASASSTALMTGGGEAMTPTSPQPV